MGNKYFTNREDYRKFIKGMKNFINGKTDYDECPFFNSIENFNPDTDCNKFCGTAFPELKDGGVLESLCPCYILTEELDDHKSTYEYAFNLACNLIHERAERILQEVQDDYKKTYRV